MATGDEKEIFMFSILNVLSVTRWNTLADRLKMYHRSVEGNWMQEREYLDMYMCSLRVEYAETMETERK
jgi:hypothetical protein